jgi:hypothetical protein
MDSGILMIQDSILVCSPDPRIPHTARQCVPLLMCAFFSQWLEKSFVDKIFMEMVNGAPLFGNGKPMMKNQHHQGNSET